MRKGLTIMWHPGNATLLLPTCGDGSRQ